MVTKPSTQYSEATGFASPAKFGKRLHRENSQPSRPSFAAGKTKCEATPCNRCSETRPPSMSSKRFGGTGAIDLFLRFVSDDYGAEIATKVAPQNMYQTVRKGDEHQPADASTALRVQHRGVAAAAEVMRTNLESPVSMEQIAARSGMSLRQMERQFQRLFRQTPQDFYRDLRLDHARNLIRSTEMTMFEIATACGFSSASYLARCHRRRFGRSPRVERARAAIRRIPSHVPGAAR